ncbi:MAG: DNA polymerase III subunit gamma/tau [Bacteroidales bacterium]|nr:DNA polymerase III subunit gamma/tau [Bacteroidales bacterium]
MENFIVSARKYRPVTFDTVVGQTVITNTLKNAIKNNHVAQAYLFCGPRGVGKTTCARILAKTINCNNLTENMEPCDKCENCLSFNKSATFNIHELDAASNNSVDDIRSLVEKVRFAPQSGKYSVYIIDEVHMLSSSAFNAFLKTLEEPPPYAKFILATTEKHKIIPTILSRCQVFDFKKITVDDIAKHLKYIAEKEKVTAEPDALHVIAVNADGSLRDALSIFDQLVSFSGNNITYKTAIANLNVLDYEYYFKITDAVFEGNIHLSVSVLNEILYNGFDGHNFITGLGEHFRNILISRHESTLNLLEVSPSVKDRYKEQSLKCNPEFLLKALNYISKCDVQYNMSRNKQLLLEITLMQMCTINSGIDANSSFDTEKQEKTELKTSPRVHNVSQPPKPANVVKPKAPEPPKYSDDEKAIPQSLKVKDIGSSYEEEKKQDVIKDAETKVVKDYTAEELEKVWLKYSETIPKNNLSFISLLTKRKPFLKENNVVLLTIDNKAQQNELTTRKAELLEFLRKELGNNQIQLEIVIEKGEEMDSKPYTDSDKLMEMQKKNPNLENLRKQFDLDIEY